MILLTLKLKLLINKINYNTNKIKLNNYLISFLLFLFLIIKKKINKMKKIK